MITSREVDVYVNRYGVQAKVPVVQYDSGRRIIFRIVDATMPSNSTAYIFVRKPSGKCVYILSTVSGNTVTVNLTNQALAEYGINFGQVRVLKNEEVITSFDVIFDVKQSYADGAIESQSGVTPAKLIDDIAVINARVDAFEALEDGSTTGDAELIDGRIGYNGTTYGSIGTAIRSQISDLHAAIDNDISADEVGYDGSESGLSATNVQGAIDEVVDSIGSQTGDTVPAEVRNAIYILLSKAAYIETGLSDELAIVEAWTATTLTITNRLTRCTTDNMSTNIASRSSYSATLTANSGYTLNKVKVTMGGVDITSTAYSSGTITIPSVTGNIVITAVAVQAVASLSAVYAQSGNVYDDFTLDDLTSNLVVTATYSDSSTAVIPSSDYTLSGTLEAGTTSTITVSYGGKTTTFNVAVSTPLYPLTVGTHNFTNPAGTIEVYNGNSARVICSTANSRDTHANLSTLSSNTAACNSTNNYVTSTPIFTIPAGATVRAKLIVNSLDSVSTATYGSSSLRAPSGTATAAALILVETDKLKVGIPDGTVFEVEDTFDAATDISCLGVYFGHRSSASAASVDVSFVIYVDGVRYI